MKEINGIVLSWVVISFCFSLSSIFEPSLFLATFIVSALTAGIGFLLHELAHRTTARRNGCYAYYQVWLWGLILALFISIVSAGRFVFAALGAVYIEPMILSPHIDEKGIRRVYGKISLSGPSMNLLLAIFFICMMSVGGIVAEISYIGLRINLWLAAFNLLPFPPLDGSKVFAWSKIIWAIFAVPTWIFVLFIS
ncbi:MAG: site-2 protease family protein [Candidatus Methanomethyliales bacterium]|nr:site-2 protease family protein [Candidatus Methanomethylicales archaeon]